MFIPTAFAESDPDRMFDLIERHSFGLLVSQIEDEPFVTHLPFLLDRRAGPHGTLVGHMARANPQWREAGRQSVLAIFTGPHAYISPTWYEAEAVVPTWNYITVHAYGRLRVIEDRPALLDIVRRSVAVYEAAMPRPWSPDWSAPHVDRLLSQIAGFHVEIERLEGKWKLNQNHPAERRRKVVRVLEERGGEDALAVAALMRANLSEG